MLFQRLTTDGEMLAGWFRETVGVDNAGRVISYASLTLKFCIGLAWTDETLRDPHTVSSYE